MTIATVARDDYIARAERLQQMARDFEAMGDNEKAEESRQGALLIYGASRAETINPPNPPVQCSVCYGSKRCDPDVHMKRRP